VLPAPALAQKTDTLVVANGDRIVGEITQLEQGYLRFKTDAMGTVSVKWDRVLSVSSDKYFEIELQSRRRWFGQIRPGPQEGTARLVLADTAIVGLDQIVTIARIRASFWSQLDGYVDVGLDVRKANATRQLNSAAQVRFRGMRWRSQLDGSLYAQRQDSLATVNRWMARLQTARILSALWRIAGVASVEHNSEIDLSVRVLGALAAGYSVFHTDRHEGVVLAGLSLSREEYGDAGQAATTTEIVTSLDYAAYRRTSPKLDVSATGTSYFSVSDPGRVRLNFTGRVSYELISDFTAAVSTFDNFDSRPPGTASSTNDYGLTFSLGYSF
jgi:hypothetical protein